MDRTEQACQTATYHGRDSDSRYSSWHEGHQLDLHHPRREPAHQDQGRKRSQNSQSSRQIWQHQLNTVSIALNVFKYFK